MTSQHPSETEGASDSPQTEAVKRRSPIERAIVWGGMVLLAIVALVEARAQRGYAMSLNQLQQAVADNDEARLPMANARAMLTFSPRESGPVLNKRSEAAYTFSWFSLFKPGTYEITIVATTGDEPVVLTVTTRDAPPKEPLTVSADEAPPTDDSSSMMPGAFLGPGGFDGGFPPPRDPLFEAFVRGNFAVGIGVAAQVDVSVTGDR